MIIVDLPIKNGAFPVKMVIYPLKMVIFHKPTPINFNGMSRPSDVATTPRQMTRKKSITDFQGVPKLMKAGSDEFGYLLGTVRYWKRRSLVWHIMRKLFSNDCG